MRRDLPRLRSARSRANENTTKPKPHLKPDQIDLRVAQFIRPFNISSLGQPRSYTSKFADDLKRSNAAEHLQIHGSMAMKKRPFRLWNDMKRPYRLRHRPEMLRTATPDRVLRFIGKSHPADIALLFKGRAHRGCANSSTFSSHPAEPPRL